MIMNSKIPGLHHVTAIASDPQRNPDFYVALLGLRSRRRIQPAKQFEKLNES